MRKSNLWIAGLVSVVSGLIFLFPLPWAVSMPCEILPGRSQGVFAEVSGELKSLPHEDGSPVGQGDIILDMENRALCLDEEKILLQLKYLEMEFDQIQADKKRYPEIQTQIKKIETARNNINELKREKSMLSVRAAFNGIFQLYDRQLKEGKWLNRGEVVGELFSPDESIVYAFADELDIGKLSVGDRVGIFLEGNVKSFAGAITAIDAIPSKNIIKASPLLDIYGGPLQTIRDASHGDLLLMRPFYRVSIRLENGPPALIGRSGEAVLRKFSSAGLIGFRWLLGVFLKELYF